MPTTGVCHMRDNDRPRTYGPAVELVEMFGRDVLTRPPHSPDSGTFCLPRFYRTERSLRAGGRRGNDGGAKSAALNLAVHAERKFFEQGIHKSWRQKRGIDRKTAVATLNNSDETIRVIFYFFFFWFGK